MKHQNYLLFAVCLILTTVVFAQDNSTVPRYFPSNHEILYELDGVEVKSNIIRSAKEQMYYDQQNNSYQLSGEASYYAEKFHNRTTANGETFNMFDLTAAHKSLPFNSVVEVRNLHNNRTVVVRINDRGPYIDGRVIDLSKRAAEEIGIIATGISLVELKVLSLGDLDKKPPGFASVVSQNRKLFEKENDKVVIQVASYSKNTNARRLVERLAEHKIIAHISRHNGYSRVVVSDLNKNDYFKISQKLTELGFSKLVVRPIDL